MNQLTRITETSIIEPVDPTEEELDAATDLSEIPDVLSLERRKNLNAISNSRVLSAIQKKYIKQNPHTHMMELINFIHDFLDKHRLPQIPRWERIAVAKFYSQVKLKGI